MSLVQYSIFDKMIEGVQIINEKWEYVYVNETVSMQGKSDRASLLGKTMMEKYPGIEKSEMFGFLEQCMREGTPHQMINEFYFPDGSKGYFELRMQRVEEGVLIMSFDVTSQKMAEKSLQDTNELLDQKVKLRTSELMSKNKELEQFAYIASHDLQEPLRTISNYIQVIEEDYKDSLDTTALKYLNAINNAAVRMSTLAKSLLDFSRLGRDRKLTCVDAGALLKEVIADLEDSIRSSGAIIEVGEMPQLNAYETEMRQLFQNLISNAIKFSKKDQKPEIFIGAEKVKDKWKFWVKDNGIGIDKAYFERIFQMFQKLHLKDEYEGSGIGLANCKKIAELHGGNMAVESGPGKGSTFIFTVSIV